MSTIEVARVSSKQINSLEATAGHAGPKATPTESAAKLHPKEHGAYAILAIPITTALLTVGLTVAGVCIAVAAFAGFLAHEPLLVAWGHRGRRAQGSTPAAKRRWVMLVSIAWVAGCGAFCVGDASVRLALVACLALACTSFGVALAGRHRTLLGQLWGVAGLSLPCVPILLAGGLSVGNAFAVWTIWLVGFCGTTLAVRSVIAAQKRQSRGIHTVALTVISLCVLASFFVPAYWLLASLPMLALSWFLLLSPPPAKYLKRVGWTLVAGTVLSAAIVLSTF